MKQDILEYFCLIFRQQYFSNTMRLLLTRPVAYQQFVDGNCRLMTLDGGASGIQGTHRHKSMEIAQKITES